MLPSRTHLVVIPTYNTGPRLHETIAAARASWAPIWVVVDGSTDGALEGLHAEAAGGVDGFRVIVLPRNRGKGVAVRVALEQAVSLGFTHALVMDADGQHPADRIEAFMAASAERPDAMVLGLPVFGPDAPRLRVRGRKVSNWWVGLETLWVGIGDSLFGFRVYPIAPLLHAMQRSFGMRRYDFDPEAVVRLSWAGVPALNLPARVRYLSASEGGVSHFRYGRDNAILVAMHIRLMLGFLWRSPGLIVRRFPGPGSAPTCRRAP